MVEFTVTVPFGTGGGYYIDGVQKPIVPVVTGGTFRFNQNAASNNGHPLILSTTTDTAGIISSGVSYYLDGVSNEANYRNTSLFNAASVRYIEIIVAQTSDFYYICNVHGSGMGNVMNITYITWGALGWNIGEWGNQGLDVTVDVGIAQGWGRVTWGEGAWNESVPIDALSLNSGTVLLSGKAQVSLTGNDLQVQTGTLQFAGKATVDVTGNGLTLTIGNATVNQIVNASTTTNLLDILIQSPNIIAGGNITDAVVGQQLGVNVGTVGFKLDQIISVTGSSVQIGIGSVVIELPSIFSATGSSVVTSIGTATVFTGSLVDVTGSSVVLNSGDVDILAGAKVLPTGSTVSVSIGTVNVASIYPVTGNQVTIGTGTLTISTQTAVDLTGNLLTVGVGSPIIYGWNIINPTTGQSWSAINPITGQTWVDIT